MSLVDKLRRIAAPVPAAVPRGGAAKVPGEARTGPLGSFWHRRLEVPLDRLHGHHPLGSLIDTPLASLALVGRDPALLDLRLDEALFFDTETTSLGGGVGTYVFLFGAGYFREGRFCVEQYFLRDVTDEPALLAAVNVLLGSFRLVVSFHGKGFDAPRLNDRLAFHKMALNLPPVHLDLCTVGRTLYRGAFDNCRLQTFERDLVGFHRRDDLPGADCPRAFFAHLQGNSALIPRVFEHNYYDVLTMPVLAGIFARELHEPAHPVVLANLGKVYEANGQDREARSAYGVALRGLRSQEHALLPRTLERLALLERRAGRHGDSAELLLERVGLPPPGLQAWEDLAKYYEHRVRDFPGAIDATLKARRFLETGVIAVDPTARRRHLECLDHRLGRLYRREGSAPSVAPASEERAT